MDTIVELKEWELEPNEKVFELTAPSWMQFKSHQKKRIDKKWRKQFGFAIRNNATVHCVVIRHPDMGHLCGYVGLPKQHKLYKADGWQMDAEVHGGITFSNFWRGRNTFRKKYWYIGFDAGHYMDYVPGLVETLRKIHEQIQDDFYTVPSIFDRTVYRNMEYMTEETTLLARQLLLPHPIDPRGREKWLTGLL